MVLNVNKNSQSGKLIPAIRHIPVRTRFALTSFEFPAGTFRQFSRFQKCARLGIATK
jgi:hypothetical protein